MSDLAHLLNTREADALRVLARNPSARLSDYLRDPQPRVFPANPIDAPYGPQVVRVGIDTRQLPTKLERMRLGLWPHVYYRFGPYCRVCGKRIADGEKAIGFHLSPTRREDRTRHAFIHADPCGGGYVVETESFEPYALADTREEAERRLETAERHIDDALACGHPHASAYALTHMPRIRIISERERTRIQAEHPRPLLDRER